ncbi:ABC transporter permease [Agrobacterium sp. LAD9]|uniref:ABC transporter permease n=1 Tax=Agrobacterium sp. LAD9 TaxID=2055153 RepID=UPI000D1EBECB|nr:ABC transporter permease [Agrobacterium sp. LAD9]
MFDFISADLFLSVLRISTPMLLAAIGGLLAWRAGVINLGLEGYMLLGAFASSAATVYAGNLYLGLLLSSLFVALIAAAMSYAIVIRGADQIVTGIMFNIFALGFTTYCASLIQGTFGSGSLSGAAEFSDAMAKLRKIPGLGELLQAINPFLIVSVLLVIGFAFILKKTSVGISIIAVGEQARAADAAGVPVNSLRCICYIIGSVIAGLGGAFLSLSYIGMFTTNMTAGQGYIAIAIIILGRWRPLFVLLSSLVFGLAFALQVRQQQSGWGLPVEVMLAFPYLLTLLIVTLTGRANGPAEEGKRFVRSSR